MKRHQEELLSQYLGPLELRIMEAVWAKGPSTVNDVLEHLNRRSRKTLVYNTVMTTLTRLADKGYLKRHREGRAYVYVGDGPEGFLRQQASATTRKLIDDLGRVGVAGIIDGLGADEETRSLMEELLTEGGS